MLASRPDVIRNANTGATSSTTARIVTTATKRQSLVRSRPSLTNGMRPNARGQLQASYHHCGVAASNEPSPCLGGRRRSVQSACLKRECPNEIDHRVPRRGLQGHPPRGWRRRVPVLPRQVAPGEGGAPRFVLPARAIERRPLGPAPRAVCQPTSEIPHFPTSEIPHRLLWRTVWKVRTTWQ